MVRPKRYFAVISGCVPLFALGTPAYAQITNEHGSEQQENRTSTMGTAATGTTTGSSPAVHESNAPQAKDAKSGSRGQAQKGPGQKPNGAGGFDNGLYGTGAGSNK
jgi:hypothetical protein